MRTVKKLAKALLVIASLLGIAVLLIVFFDDATGLEIFPDLDTDFGLLLPAVPAFFVVALVGAFGGKLFLTVLGFSLPLILLIGVVVGDRSKWFYRLTVYPILLGSAAFAFVMDGLTAVFAITYLLLAILADFIPD